MALSNALRNLVTYAGLRSGQLQEYRIGNFALGPPAP